jgi:hypothetical protein
MLHLAFALYAVSSISLPPGTNVDLAWTTQEGIATGAPPANIALSPRGSVAVVLSNDAPREGALVSRILVVRRDGTRVILNRPDDSMLAQSFGVYGIGPSGEHAFPDARFTGVTMADDGTPAATVEYQFSGAYSGIESANYLWNGARWRSALPSGKLPVATTNFSSIAVDTPTRYACNGDYDDTVALLDEAENDPHYQENEALLVDGSRTLALGYGAVTAMRGTFVVGYFAGMKHVLMNQSVPPLPPEALEWTAGKRLTLGPGIAYGVNARGDAVGDDGHGQAPMLWHNARALRLSDAPGTAYGIGADGTIVGRVGDDAFLARGDDSTRKLVRIDSLLRDSGWHIAAAYAIASSGRILATGRHRGGPMTLLVLDPA